MSNSVTIEQRKYIRLDYMIPVALKFCGSQEITSQALCRNISFGGMGLEINSATLTVANIPFKPQTPISARVELPHRSETITVYGTVRWSRVDEDAGKIFIGIEFSTEKHKDAACILFDYARKEIKRKKTAIGWFAFSISTMIFLSIWGVRLHMQNNQLDDQLNQLTNLRVEMEKSLLRMREIKFDTEAALQKAHKENLRLSQELKILEHKTSLIKTSISNLENQISSANVSGTPELSGLKNTLQEKSKLSESLDTLLAKLNNQLEENERIVAKLHYTHEKHSRAFYNRFSAKKKLDGDIRKLSAQTRLSANIVPSGYTELPRSMWVRNGELFKFPDRTDNLLSFCADRNINLIFAQVDVTNPLLRDQYPIFLQKAHEHGIAVHAYFKPRYPSTEKNCMAIRSWITKVVAYNNGAQNRFDGINIELYLTKISHGSTMQSMAYLELLDSIVSGRNKHQSKLEIGATVSYSTDKPDSSYAPLVFKDRTAHLNLHLIDTVDYVAIATPDTPASVQEEIHYASRMGKKMYVAQPFDLGNDSYNPTQSSTYIHKLEQQIKEVIEAYLDLPAFMGITIDDYTLYAQCVEDTTPKHIKETQMKTISFRPPKVEYHSSMMK